MSSSAPLGGTKLATPAGAGAGARTRGGEGVPQQGVGEEAGQAAGGEGRGQMGAAVGRGRGQTASPLGAAACHPARGLKANTLDP